MQWNYVKYPRTTQATRRRKTKIIVLTKLSSQLLEEFCFWCRM